MFNEAAWTFIISVFSPAGAVALVLTFVIRLFVRPWHALDVIVGFLLNVPAIVYWISWLTNPPSTGGMTPNTQIMMLFILYFLGLGGLGAGWILAILVRGLAKLVFALRARLTQTRG
jgi:hypothetical protein